MDHVKLEPELSGNLGILKSPRDFSWLEKSVPCQHACPAATDVPSYLEAIAMGNFDEAYRINLRDNVFPAILGRICTRPCESACRHGERGLGDPVAICFSKRSAADFSRSRTLHKLPPLFPPSGLKVAVIGSGPSGLAAARDLCLYGHTVTVYEQYDKPGGMMTQNIPPFRLPRSIVEHEVEQIRQQGVDIICSTRVGADISLSRLYREYDALIAAGGCTRPNVPEIPGIETVGVLHAPDYLRRLIEGERQITGRRVIVIGGGFTAVDSARAALRDGAESVTICYRRRKEDMTITPGEFEALEEEGIGLECLVSPTAIRGGAQLSSIRFIRNRAVGDPGTGKASIEEKEGSHFDAAVDTVLLATGQAADFSWIEQTLQELELPNDRLFTDASLPHTAQEKLFLAGDQGKGSTTVIEAVASGRKCAQAVDHYLTGRHRVERVLSVTNGRNQPRPLSFNNIERQKQESIAIGDRNLEREVELGLIQGTAVKEARRCYVCSYNYEIDTSRCIFCDLCCEVKPREGCIQKVAGILLDREQRITGFQFPVDSFQPDNQFVYRIDPAACIRCNRCLEVCPVGCITVSQVRTESLFTETEEETAV